jgi:glycerol-3-phosphate acyltransferase PlsY
VVEDRRHGLRGDRDSPSCAWVLRVSRYIHLGVILVNGLLAIALGYVLGSILPAYLLGRLRGVDLRTLGDGNLGTTNAAKYLGTPVGVITAIYDLFKGPLAMLVAWRFLGVAETWVFAAGVAAVVGHRYPFYLRFRGGRGYATATGLLFTSVGLTVWFHILSPAEVLVLALAYGGLFFVYRTRNVPNAIVLPVFLTAVLWRSATDPDAAFCVFVAAVAVFIWLNAVHRLRQRPVFGLGTETRRALGEIRVLLRPLALAFPVLYLFVDKQVMLTLVGTVALVFLLIDAVRLLSRRVNVAVLRKASFFYRPNEEHAFSSATMFLVGSFVTLFLFPKPVASAAIVYVIVGDLLAKYAGLQHGRVAIFSRTLEGSVMYFVACVVAGFVWSHFVVLAPAQYVLGALVASVTEVLPWDVNDNFAVPILAGAAMMVPPLVRL